MTSSDSSTFPRPSLTVAAIIEKEGRFLFVEERSEFGGLVINQPAGHVEPLESVEQAVIRETYEETAWGFLPESLVSIYLWTEPVSRRSYLRVCFTGQLAEHDPSLQLDEGIVRTLWLSRDELLQESARLRSPMVLRGIEDYLAGVRYPLSILQTL
jgi:8-oxo-dGTP pyrophosphatase MutT (NUDIX family)